MILKFVFIYSTICIASKFILIIGPYLIPHTLSFAAYQRICVQSLLINIKFAEMLLSHEYQIKDLTNSHVIALFSDLILKPTLINYICT